MEKTGTYPIGLDTPIHLLTPRQLFEMMSEWYSSITAAQQAQPDKHGRWVVNSIQELADILGTSRYTVYRMKREGILNDCLSQYGKWMVIDVNAVLEKLKLSNQIRRKYKLRINNII